MVVPGLTFSRLSLPASVWQGSRIRSPLIDHLLQAHSYIKLKVVKDKTKKKNSILIWELESGTGETKEGIVLPEIHQGLPLAATAGSFDPIPSPTFFILAS